MRNKLFIYVGFLVLNLSIFPLNAHAKDAAKWINFMEAYKEETNLKLVKKAFDLVIVKGEAEGLKYFAEDYIQHNPTIDNGRQPFADFFVNNRPEDLTVEIDTIIADGDFVVLRSRFRSSFLGSLIAADIYKVENGLIVEHWDVVQSEVPAEQTGTGKPMFPVAELSDKDFKPSKSEYENKRIGVQAINRLFGFSDVSVLDELFSDDYIQYNPIAPGDGVEPLAEIVGTLPPGGWGWEIGLALSYGNIVFLHSRFDAQDGTRGLAADFFLVEDGEIKVHWDAIQTEVPTIETVNGNPMFPIF